MKCLSASLLSIACLLSGVAAYADDYAITLKDNQFTPQEITLPAHKAVNVTITNEQESPAEFESVELDREKVISPHATINVLVGPLQPGTYTFFDDFHRDSKGSIIVK